MMVVTIASQKLRKSLKPMIKMMEQVMLEIRSCINVLTRIVMEKRFSRCPGSKYRFAFKIQLEL
uniref:Uncharacterized protein n=1 Tax=Helianthus annuus TaxID=4232 RepID=A0A251U7K3_HELAN